MIRSATLDQPRKTSLRRFAATLAAAATALALMTAAAMPARADSSHAAKVSAGTATIAVIGSAPDNGSKAEVTQVQHTVPWWQQPRWLERDHDRPGYGRPGHDRPGYDRPGHGRPGHDRPGYGRPGDDHDNGHGRPGNRPPRDEVRGPRLPGVCAFTVDLGRSYRTVYSGRCLEREGFSARLPRACAETLRINGRRDRVYNEACLVNAGFRLGQRRY